MPILNDECTVQCFGLGIYVCLFALCICPNRDLVLKLLVWSNCAYSVPFVLIVVFNLILCRLGVCSSGNDIKHLALKCFVA